MTKIDFQCLNCKTNISYKLTGGDKNFICCPYCLYLMDIDNQGKVTTITESDLEKTASMSGPVNRWIDFLEKRMKGPKIFNLIVDIKKDN